MPATRWSRPNEDAMSSDRPAVSGHVDRSALRVLLVDDEPDSLDVYRRALQGYRLRLTQWPDQAMALLGEHGSDIVVTDQSMPGMTGAQLLERARAVNPLVRRVIVSAHAEVKQLLEAINCGEVERYLVKPIVPEELRNAVDQLGAQYLALQAERTRIAQLEEHLESLQQQLNLSGAPAGWELLDLEVARARHYQRPLACIVVHGGGGLRRELTARFRAIDMVVPLGNRLIVALPDTDLAAVEALRQRLRTDFPGPEFRVAVFPDHGQKMVELLAFAEQQI
jgi:CheY-like chemotaxis protein